MSEEPQGKKNIKIDTTLDPEYKYRDLFNLHMSPEEVMLEFGNICRDKPGEGVIRDRIVLTPGNAMRLQQLLSQSIAQMQQRMQDIARQKNNQPPEHN